MRTAQPLRPPRGCRIRSTSSPRVARNVGGCQRMSRARSLTLVSVAFKTLNACSDLQSLPNDNLAPAQQSWRPMGTTPLRTFSMVS